ncbi:MAG: TolC family protein [Ignavibacteria bacterium]|nr:TolC family protein [Ignavibacteria bacterium]
MNRTFLKILLIGLLFFGNIIIAQNTSQNVIYLSMNEVIGKSRNDNLSLKSKLLEYDSQSYEVWKSYSLFSPTFHYQGIATNNLELPVFVFMGQQFVVGTKFTFQHSLDLTIPLFTGGSRWFNMNIQKSLKKSLSEELKGKEEEVVLQSLQAYYGVILAHSILATSEEAAQVSKMNLEQVEKFYNVGKATELDLQRAKAQYSANLPTLEKAKADKIMSSQRLKFLLNIDFNDSLVITDTLESLDFMNDFKNLELYDFKNLSKENRSDIKSLAHKLQATKEGENITMGSFLPSIALSANVAHQAQLGNSNVMWNDYIRSKSINLVMSWPLFEGGRRLINYQQAKIQTEQMKILYEQADKGRLLDVEESYYSYHEAVKNLESLKELLLQTKESLRLSNLLYSEGMSTQLDVLNAQLFNTSSQMQYYQGIYFYNISQLNLLYSIGLLNEIWK